MKLKLPPAFSLDKEIAVVALSSAVEWDNCEKSIELLARKGYSLSYNEVELRAQEGYLAGSDEMRRKQLIRALEDNGIGAIFAARGGFGVTRVMEDLDIELIRKNPKWLLGFSDITALGMLWNIAGLVWLHSPLFTTYHSEPEAVQERTLKFIESPKSFIGEKILSGKTLVKGEAEGTLFGGNLVMITAMLGTPYFPDLTGKILLIEEIGEEPYRLDRMFTQLRLSGALHKVSGVVAGSFTNCKPKAQKSFSADEVIAERLGDLSVPVIVAAPFGHEPPNYPLPIGARARLNATKGELSLLDYEGEI
ncbi:MAG: LD-carboxypeptidase [Myxococcota bacterium]